MLADLREDDRGLWYAAPLFKTLAVPDILPALRAGLLGASFRFTIEREDWNAEAPRSAHNPQGLPERRIYEVSLKELGPVVWPAYR